MHVVVVVLVKFDLFDCGLHTRTENHRPRAVRCQRDPHGLSHQTAGCATRTEKSAYRDGGQSGHHFKIVRNNCLQLHLPDFLLVVFELFLEFHRFVSPAVPGSEQRTSRSQLVRKSTPQLTTKYVEDYTKKITHISNVDFALARLSLSSIRKFSRASRCSTNTKKERKSVIEPTTTKSHETCTHYKDRVKRPSKCTDLLACSSLQNLFGILVRLLRCCDFHRRLDRRHPCSAVLF